MGYRALALVMPVGASARRILGTALVVLVPLPLAAHPLHTSVAILDYDRHKGTIELSIRVFADDFEHAAAQRSARLSPPVRNESPLLAYVRASFTVTDGGGRSLPLEWCGWRRQGDLVWLCFRSHNIARGDLTIADRIFHDLYDDQINIVQARNRGHSTNLLFTKSDGAKRIR